MYRGLLGYIDDSNNDRGSGNENEIVGLNADAVLERSRLGTLLYVFSLICLFPLTQTFFVSLLFTIPTIILIWAACPSFVGMIIAFNSYISTKLGFLGFQIYIVKAVESVCLWPIKIPAGPKIE